MELVVNVPPSMNSEVPDESTLKSSAVTEAIYCAKTFKILGVKEVFLKSGLPCWGNPSTCFCITHLGDVLYWPRPTPKNWESEEVGFSYGQTILNFKPQLVLIGIEDLTHRFLDN